MIRISIAVLCVLGLLLAAADVGAQDQKAVVDSAESADKAEPAVSDDGFFAEAQVFGDWAFRFADDDDFNEFQLRRGELAVGWEGRWAAGYVNVEAIRSAGPDSFGGIDGNSLVPRFKHAFGMADPTLGPGRVVVQGGLVADPWVRALETGYSYRGVAPLVSEQGLFFDTSDLGLVVGYDFADGFAELHWAITNGEGRNEVEQNPGKNSTIVLSVRPVSFAFYGDEARLGVHATYRDGSIGTGSVRNHRFGGAVTFDHDWIGAGFEFVQALGYLGRGSRTARGLASFAHGHAWRPWFGLHARFATVNTDLEATDASVQTISGGVFGDVSRPEDPLRMRWYVTYENASNGPSAGPVPGVPSASATQSVLLTLQVVAGPQFLQTL